MLRLVRNLALGAAFLTLAVAVWRDYGAMITLKRMVIAYLLTFFVGGALVALATVGLRVNQPPPPPPEPTRRERSKAAEMAQKAATAARDALDQQADVAASAEPLEQPEPIPAETG